MANNSPIEWTESTWNPIVGCSILSPGCTNCYAMTMAARIEAMNAEARESDQHDQAKRRRAAEQYDGTTKKVNGHAVWTGKLALAPDHVLLAPLKRKKPTTYFVNSMGDLFHENCPDEWIDKVFAVMALTPQHTYQVLTKRAGRMRDYLTSHDVGGRWAIEVSATSGDVFPLVKDAIQWSHHGLPNVWLGVSTERQQEADERIPHLLNTPASVRFVSVEPLLGPLDLSRICILPQRPGAIRAGIHLDALRGKYCESGMPYIGDWDITKPAPEIPAIHLDWVIVGGESGPGGRPMHPDWARSLRDQCAAAGVPFFFKQWGQWAPQLGAIDLYEFGEVSRRQWVVWEDGQWEFWDRPAWCDDIGAPEDCLVKVGKKAAGRHLDGITHDAMPSTSSCSAASARMEE